MKNGRRPQSIRGNPREIGILPSSSSISVLAADEPPACTIAKQGGLSPFVLVCDHASRRLPRSLGSLGLSPLDASSHIAWDIGALQVAQRISEQLDATLLIQNYSRLAIDCNRPPAAPDSIADCSDGICISGNENLDLASRAARYVEIFAPYHRELAGLLDQRQLADRPALLLAVHSFTPTFGGVSRPWHIGLMYRHDQRLGRSLLALLRAEDGLCVGDNEPYAIEDASDYTLPVHGEKRGIAHVGIEIRQDLIATSDGQRRWAERLARLLTRAATLVIPA